MTGVQTCALPISELRSDLGKTLKVFEQLISERGNRLDKDVAGIREYFTGASALPAPRQEPSEHELCVRRSLRQLSDFILVAQVAMLIRGILGEPDPLSHTEPSNGGSLERTLRDLRRVSQDSMIATIGSGGGQGDKIGRAHV